MSACPLATAPAVRDLGRPLISIWIIVILAGFLMSFLACALTVLDDMFR